MPDDSFLRFENESDRERYLPILIEVYAYESTKVSGSSGGVRKFSDCIWTREEILGEILPKLSHLKRIEVETRLDELIALMADPVKRHMIKFKKQEVNYHLTRVGEMIRTVSCLHEYTNRDVKENGNVSSKKYPIVDGSRWEPRLRFGASRNISPASLVVSVRSAFSPTHRLPATMGGHTISTAISDLELVLEAANHVIAGGNIAFSKFQSDSIVKAFENSWAQATNSALVITAGTGMGKTLGFIIPVITDALISNRANGRQCSQLLMYPRNDLAKDQFEQMTKIVSRLNHNLITSGNQDRCLGTALDADSRITNHQLNYPNSGGVAVPWGAGTGNVYAAACNTYAGDNPASIIACSIESFRRRLRIPDVCASLKQGLRRIVLDEVHLSSGIQGGHHSRILSRCKQIAYPRTDLTFIGVSATIAKPREHVSKIWHSSDDLAKDVDHVDSETLDRESPMGIRHNVMVRPRKGTSPLGTLVDMTSAVTHQRRSRDFYDRPTKGAGFDYEALQKTIGFADSHEIVGNWYSYLLDNESTSKANRLENSSRRPYSHWHERPLRTHAGGDDVCKSCQKMSYHATPVNIPEDKLGEFIYDPDSTNTPPNPRIHKWHLPLYPSGCGSQKVSGLDTCHHLESGTCWWFAPRTSEPESRPGNPGYTSYRDVIRSKRHTGKTNSSTQESSSPGEAKADYSFKQKPRGGAYPGGEYPDGHISHIPHDIAIATPTLEVGVDMSNVSDVLTHKAIRNVSSYRQKVGRAGREPGTDAVAMTLMSLRRQEFQYYRSMVRLVDSEILDPVPVANNNLAMKKNQAYECVFDFLAKNGHQIEFIEGLIQALSGSPGHASWISLNTAIQAAIDAISTPDAHGNPVGITHACNMYLTYGVKVQDPEIRKKAACFAAKHLKYFLELMPISTASNPVTVIQYLASKNRSIPLDAAIPNLVQWSNLRIQINTYEPMMRSELNPTEITDFEPRLQAIKSALDDSNVIGFNTAISDFDTWITKLKPLRVQCTTFFAIVKAMAMTLTPSPRIAKICDQVKGLTPRKETRYLSMVMMNCPIFLEDTPYAPLATLFQNPHEAPVEVKRQNDWSSEYITGKEALRYTMPGMWTHRLFRGQRMFIPHRGNTTLQAPGKPLKLHLDGGTYSPEFTPSSLGGLSASDVQRISPMLEVTADSTTTLWKLKTIHAVPDTGVNGMPNSIFQGRPPYKGAYYNHHDTSMGDVIDGPAGMLNRPRAHSITWQLSEASADGCLPSRTYKIANTQPASTGEPETLSVTSHPLLSGMFNQINFDSKMSVRRLSLGVARSNLIVMQNFFNENSAAFADHFVTNGLRFHVKQRILADAYSKGHSSDHPFDERVIRMLGAWMLSEDKYVINSFLLEMFLDIMVDEAWRQSNSTQNAGEFPETIEQFIELLFNSGNVWDNDVFDSRAEQDAIATDYTGDEANSLREIYQLLIGDASVIRANYQSMMGDWYRKVFLNTLGLALSEATSEFSGVSGDAVSYTFVNNSNSEEESYIDVFDDDAEGNGSTELANKFFHIPVEVRELAQHFDDTNLPTTSFAEVIEERLRMCEEHMLHSISLTGNTPLGIPRWMELESRELHNRFFTDRWDAKGITETRLATLQNRRKFAYTNGDRTELLNWDLALSLCDVDCPACNGDDFGNLFPPHLVMYTTCRAVLDDVLGDWVNYEGYLRKSADRTLLQTISGDPVASTSYIHIKGSGFGSLPIRQRFVNYPCPAIGLSWQRFMPVPAIVDKYVRHQEVL